MKKLLTIVVLGLIWCNISYANHKCEFRDIGPSITCEENKTYNKHTCKCEGFFEQFNTIENTFPNYEEEKKIKLREFNSKLNKQLGFLLIIIPVLIAIIIAFRKKILLRITNLKKIDKGLFRLWSVLSILWFIGSLFYIHINLRIFFFHYDGFSSGNTTYGYEQTPLDALVAILVFCILPPLLLIIIWLIAKWIYKGFK